MSAPSRHWSQLRPAEHGAWSLLLTPFLVGLGMALATAGPSGGALPALLLFAGLGLAVFLVRQPVGALLRLWRGRARRGGASLAARWTLALALLAALCGLGLLALGRQRLLPLAIPAGAVLAASLLVAAFFGPRGLALELLGALGLALAAPGAYAAVCGLLDAGALAAWGVSAAHSLTGVLYVRLRIAARHDRVSRGLRAGVAGAHVLTFAGVLVAAMAAALPPLAALPFGLLLARALWAAWRTPPLRDVRRFGFAEMGLALAFAALVVLAYLAP